MKSVGLKGAAFALCITLGAGLPAWATTVLFQDVPALTRGADTIVVGRVLQSESRWSGDRRRIVTDVTVEVGEVLKGAPAKTVVIRQPGGQVGDIGQRVDGMASFQTGEEVMLFLERRPDHSYRVEGLAQGKFRVERSSDGKAAFAVPEGAAGARVLDPMTQEERRVQREPVALDELKAQVRRVLAEPVTPDTPSVPVQKGTQ